MVSDDSSKSRVITRAVKTGPVLTTEQSEESYLVVVDSDQPTLLDQKYMLGATPLTIGRSSKNTITLEDDSVSRNHCRIEKRGYLHFFVDLESLNGSFINGRLVRETELTFRDEIKIGNTLFAFLNNSDACAAKSVNFVVEQDDQLEEILLDLTIEIDQVKRQQQVAHIKNSPYFQEIHAEIKSLQKDWQ